MKMPRLIQRICKPDQQSTPSGGFSYDYMGTGEFEYGALAVALQSMRKKDLTVRKIFRVKSFNADLAATVYYVGSIDKLAEATEFFNLSFDGSSSWKSRIATKERTYIYESYKSDWPNKPSIASKYIGWWAIEKEHLWALFKSEDDAYLWKRSIDGGKQ